MFLLPTFKYWHLLEAEKHASLVPTFSFHVNAVEKDSTYERLCNSLDQKCVDKCTYALMTILPFSKGNVHTQVHNSTVVFLNCEQEEYSLCIFFPLMSTACLPSLLLLTNPDLLHAQQWLDHTYKLIWLCLHSSQALSSTAHSAIVAEGW